MIDERFSATSFEDKGLNSSQALELCGHLQNEIQNELHKNTMDQITRLVNKLNEMGHNLRLTEVATPGDITYHDLSGPMQGCKLRLAVTTVISVGYAHQINESDLPDDL